MIAIDVINRERFESIDAPVLFGNVNDDRRFALASIGDSVVKFSWQSDLLLPKIVEFEYGVGVIGVDLFIAVFDFKDKLILFKLKLDYFLFEIIRVKNNIVVVSELNIHVVSMSNQTVIKIIDLPDIYLDAIFHENKMQVECANGETVLVEI